VPLCTAGALADVNLHVEAANCGLVEATHESLMLILARYLRQVNIETPGGLRR